MKRSHSSYSSPPLLDAAAGQDDPLRRRATCTLGRVRRGALGARRASGAPPPRRTPRARPTSTARSVWSRWADAKPKAGRRSARAQGPDDGRRSSRRLAAHRGHVRGRPQARAAAADSRRVPAARALVVQKSPDAESHLTRVHGMLTEAEKIGVWDETLADLRTLVDGFLDCPGGGGSLTAPAPAVPETDATRPDPRRTRRVYTAGDADVVAPVAVSSPRPMCRRRSSIS